MKKVLFILGALILLGGTFVALALFGVIKIKGLPQLKHGKLVAAKATNKPQLDRSSPAPANLTKAPAPVTKPSPAPAPPALPPQNGVTDDKKQKDVKKAAPTTDPAKGLQAVATLWNTLEPEKLSLVIQDWKDADVAKVFRKMDPDAVSDVLAALPPKRASKISAMIEMQAAADPGT
jgi:flagellar motility protein MotE (MotC chaperone)